MEPLAREDVLGRQPGEAVGHEDHRPRNGGHLALKEPDDVGEARIGLPAMTGEGERAEGEACLLEAGPPDIVEPGAQPEAVGREDGRKLGRASHRVQDASMCASTSAACPLARTGSHTCSTRPSAPTSTVMRPMPSYSRP